MSTTVDRVDSTNPELVTADVVEGIRRLKEQPGDDISVTGAVLLTYRPAAGRTGFS